MLGCIFLPFSSVGIINICIYLHDQPRLGPNENRAILIKKRDNFGQLICRFGRVV